MKTQVIDPWTWQEQFGFVQAHAVTGAERIVYSSGQTSMDADGTPLHDGNMRAQLVQALDNLEVVLGASGCTLADVVRLDVFTTDVDGFFPVMDVLVGRLQEAGCRPASSLLGVSRLALPPLLVELEATAVAEAAM